MSNSTIPTSSNPFTTSSFSTSEILPTTAPPSSAPPTTSEPTSTTSTSALPTSNPPSSPPATFVSTVSRDGLPPITVVMTSTLTPTADNAQTPASSSSTSTSTPGLAGDSGSGGSGGGLSGGGKTAVEVIVPIVVVALLVLAGLWFWRKRKQRKDVAEVRRKEVEEYGYNPNDDPTLPAVGGVKSSPGQDGPFEMREDDSGYRGWGTTAVGSSGRKASTTLSGGPPGIAYSEGTSPSHGPISDARSGDTLVGSPSGRPASDGPEEVLGAMGPAAAGNRSGDVHRGPSNASSSYSAANRSDGSGEAPLPGGSFGGAQYYAGDANYGGPYADGSFGGAPGGRAEMSGQPVIRDNLARRATRIENPSHFPTQASAGIAQNF